MQIYCTTISVKHQQGGRERDRGDSSLSVTGGRSRRSFSPPSFCSFTMIWQKQPEAKQPSMLCIALLSLSTKWQ